MKSQQTGLGGPADGVLRVYIAVPVQSVVKIPESSTLSYAQWASVVCTGVTAKNALYGNLPLKPGQAVLFQDKQYPKSLLHQYLTFSYRCWRSLLVLGKAAGATTIITLSSDEKLHYVKENYQVDHVMNYKKSPD